MRRNAVRRTMLAVAATVTAAALAVPIGLALRNSAGASVAANFVDDLVIGGLQDPVNVEITPDGTVFVAEKAGVIKRFDGLADDTPAVVADLRAEVNSFWDRGLLGLAVDPKFAQGRPYVYALYTYDAAIGGTAPVWNDACPNPPGANEAGCPVSGRLARLTIGPEGTAVASTVLIEDWCQQYPSHSVGDLAFLPDGSLAVSAGDGASFTGVDYGQLAGGANPCGDPAGEGGALRSQDLRTTGDPTGLSGAILRIDPDTGAGRGAFGGDANASRIYAHGFRNPVRMTARPGTGELWVTDVGWAMYEEIDVVGAGGANYGWPCHEGPEIQAAYAAAGLELCNALASSAVASPYFSYRSGQPVSADGGCGTGGQSASAIAFYRDGSYPADYRGALFFGDYSRRCIWVMPATGGIPDPSRVRRFASGVFPVDLTVGPGGDIFYLDITTGLHRISYAGANQAPTAVIQASALSGPIPLSVTFDAGATVDPTPLDIVSFAWDLDGDGAFDDASGPTASTVFGDAGAHRVGLRATDSYGASSDAFATITATSTGPTLTLDQPQPALRWRVGDSIAFAATAVDPTDGPLPPSAFTWRVVLHHCAPGGSDCHDHQVQTFDGIAQGSIPAPDHGFPSYLTVSVTARNRAGLTATKELRLDPATVELRFDTQPSGLSLTVGESTQTTPFVHTAILGSSVMLAAAPTQVRDGVSYPFVAWSDGGERAHVIPASGPASFTAQYSDGSTPGNATLERWTGVPGARLDALPAGTPASTHGTARGLVAPSDDGDGHGTRLRALVRPPATGDYTFWISSDDASLLNLSPSADPSGRRSIASSPAWTAPGDYDQYPSQRSEPVALVAGEAYYLEAWAKDDGGPDHLSVAWSGPGLPAREVVPDSALSAAPTPACAGWCPIPASPAPSGDAPVVLDTWTNAPGFALASIPEGTVPTSTAGLRELRAPANRGEQLGSRLRVLLTPPATGDYRFWIASDDEGALNLSATAEPARRRRIASVPGWVGELDFDAVPAQRSAPVALVAGSAYYLEAWAKEGGGGDHLSVAWEGPGFARTVIPGGAVSLATAAPCGGAWCPDAPVDDPNPDGPVVFETWTGQPGFSLDTIPEGAVPSATSRLSVMQAPADRGGALGTRLRTLVTAPQTGAFTFWLASDDEGVLNVSTSADPALRRTVARVPYWSGPASFDELPSQRSEPIALVQGQQYYVEAWAKEGDGGDHLAVAWSGPGLTGREIVGGGAAGVPPGAPCPGWCPRVATASGAAVQFDSWEGVPGFPLTAIPAGTLPTAVSTLSEMAAPSDRGAQLGTRLRALLTAPATGRYVFHIASDDQGVLAFAPSADPAGRRVIAWVPFWSGDRVYAQAPPQRSAEIDLVAGQQYFIEAWAKDGGGSDHLSVAWTPPGATGAEAIPASVLTATASGCAGWCPPSI